MSNKKDLNKEPDIENYNPKRAGLLDYFILIIAFGCILIILFGILLPLVLKYFGG